MTGRIIQLNVHAHRVKRAWTRPALAQVERG